MTYVASSFNFSPISNRRLKYYTVEIVTFNGESFTEEVEARSSEEAIEIAASMYDEVDYVMIQGCFVA
ncbi:MAG: DpnD/PcfM family protein [Muribaculaceae bacterium]|nr:DpnD/PcfM family protein [Muribaculaceae bacterium]